MKHIYLLSTYWYVIDRWKLINEAERYIVCLDLVMIVSNFLNFVYVIRIKPPLSFTERDWEPIIAEQHLGAQQNVAELCWSVMSPPWGVTERAEAQTIVTIRFSAFQKPHRYVVTPPWRVSQRSLMTAVTTEPPGRFVLCPTARD